MGIFLFVGWKVKVLILLDGPHLQYHCLLRADGVEIFHFVGRKLNVGTHSLYTHQTLFLPLNIPKSFEKEEDSHQIPDQYRFLKLFHRFDW